MNTKPELGQWVTIKGVLKKTRTEDEVVSWVRQPLEPCPAMFIGTRRVFNGYWYHGESVEQGYYTEFHHGKSVLAYLFVFNDRRNPVYVSPEDVELAS